MVKEMKLRIMNETGDTNLVVNTVEMCEQIAEHPTHWVYVDGDMISRESVVNVDWNDVESVNLVPALVGGSQ